MLRPFRYLSVVGSVVLACAAGAGAQTIIDNDQVRVLVAHDQPHVKTKPHDHKINRVMVYLNAGKQEVVNEGKTSYLQYKAGQALWSPKTTTHTAEVVSAEPVTIIEVELKKDGDPKKVPTAALDPVKVDPKHYKVEFENAQVRVVRVHFPVGEGAPLHEHVLNRVVCYVSDQKVKVTTDGKAEVVEHKAGEASWGGAAKHSEQNVGNQAFEAVVVELKY
jgi:quercetin dioxygenase-like cupin family protein